MVSNKTIIPAILILSTVCALITGCNRNVSLPSEDSDKSVSSANSQGEAGGGKTDTEGFDYPEDYLITDENYFDYQPGLECAAFSSAYVLRHFGEEADGLELFKDFPNKLPNEAGVFPAGVERFWNERDGYTAEFKSDGTIDELKSLVSTGVPVIVFVHVEEPYESVHNTHYLPLIGYDKDYFYFAESLDYLANCKDEVDLAYNRKTELAKFERLWANIDGAWDNPYFVIAKG